MQTADGSLSLSLLPSLSHSPSLLLSNSLSLSQRRTDGRTIKSYQRGERNVEGSGKGKLKVRDGREGMRQVNFHLSCRNFISSPFVNHIKYIFFKISKTTNPTQIVLPENCLCCLYVLLATKKHVHLDF